MPAFATHYFYAIDILLKLDEETRTRLEKYFSYYKIGAQGPDIYYSYKPLKKNYINEYGKELHKTKFSKIIEEAIPRIKKYDDEGALIYLLGVATHHTLDSAMHKYIKEAAKDNNDHLLIETDLEHAILSNHLKKYLPYKFRRNLLITYPGGKKKALGYQINLVFPKVDNKVTNEVIYQLDFYLGWLYSPRMIKAKLVKFLTKKFGDGKTDYTLMIIKKERSGKHEKTIKFLVQKYDEMIDVGIENIKNILDYYENNGKLNKAFNKDFM